MTEKKPRCPVCGKLQLVEHKPFCSRHCADIDLGRWLTESYKLPADPENEDEDDGDEG